MRIDAIPRKTGLFLAPAVLIIAVTLLIPACMPSYPKEKLPEMVKAVCKLEYDMDVNVTVVGSTIGIYYPMNGLLDVGMGISEEAWEKISNLILIASRVVLSTDADIKFYCVITQDARLPELQVVIIKYVGDVKLGMYSNISRDESLKRTLFSINLTPQAKKERSIETVFERLGVEEETKQKVLDEFFRSPPTKLSDIGYWRENFYLKDITLEEFLAAQIANRVKIEFRAEKNLSKMFEYKNSEGVFVSDKGSRAFVIKFKIDDHATSDTAGVNLKAKKIQEIMRVANEVVSGYKFESFDYLFMEDQEENTRLSASVSDVYNFNRNRTPVDKVVKAPAGYFN